MADYKFSVGKEAKFTASDATLTTHKWLIDGVQVSTNVSFTYKFNTAGLYKVRHEGSSQAGACTPVEKTIEITSEEKPPYLLYTTVGLIVLGMVYLITKKNNK